MQIVIDIPAEDILAIQFHSAEELGIDFAQEVFERIKNADEIIDERSVDNADSD